jgi:hypothetical protein
MSARSLRHVRLLAALALASLLLAGCGDDAAGPATTPSGGSPSGGSASAAPSPSGGSQDTTLSGVYFMTETRTGPRLMREQRDLPTQDTATGAVRAMIAGPEDPDYTSPWNPATQVLGVTRRGLGFRVDLSEDARTANIGSAGAALMIQQLVYTVTESTDKKAGVQLYIEGEPAGELWGAVSWDEPVFRAGEDRVRGFVQIDTPREGATASSPLTVTGEANVFEANVPWRVLDADGAVVEEGFTMTSEAFRFAPYSFTVDLEPGTYTVEVTEDDPSDGEMGTPMSDTRTVTVG